MSIRVHELAKALKLSSKELLTHLKALKVPAKNHMSTLDEETAEILRHEIPERLGRAPAPTPATAIPAPTPAVAPAPTVAASVAVAEATTPAPAASPPPAPTTPVLPAVEIAFPITVKALAERLQEKPNVVIKRLIDLGVFATINQALDHPVVAKFAEAYGFTITLAPSSDELSRKPRYEVAAAEQLVARAPVVTLMGHVDHGKTSLLDAIRQTNVTAQEAGGITQHIGAYSVELPGKGRVTFLDTPGHEAFTAMRARGTTVTDVVVLVVAADDGVMPQTIEAIDHAKAASVPIVVAINKIDKPEADPERVKRELMVHGLVPEEWGGKTIMAGVSAKTRQGLDQLLEMLLLEAELLELKADPSQAARGTVLEGKLSKGGGPIANVLVQNGTLRVGDLILAGASSGRVRALIDEHRHRVQDVGPAQPIEVLGLQGIPQAGDSFLVMTDERLARELVEQRQAERHLGTTIHAPRLRLEDLHQKIAAGAVKELKLILKADVQGSLEALRANLEKLTTEEVKLLFLHVGVGDINESDVMLAAASEAIVIGFHVGVDWKAQEQAIREGVDLRLYQIIYEATDEVRRALEGLLTPEKRETLLGTFQITQVFKVSKVGLVAGGIVSKGKVARAGTVARVKRGGQVLYEGKLSSLKRFKDDVREVAEGLECGLNLEGFSDYQAGDVIEVYHVEEVARKLA